MAVTDDSRRQCPVLWMCLCVCNVKHLRSFQLAVHQFTLKNQSLHCSEYSFVYVGEVSRFAATEAPHPEPQQVQIKHRDTSTWPSKSPQHTACAPSLYYPLSVFLFHFLHPHLHTSLPCSHRSLDSRWGPSISQHCYYNPTLAELHPKAPKSGWQSIIGGEKKEERRERQRRMKREKVKKEDRNVMKTEE